MKPRAHVVLYKSDFANLDVWYGLLDKLDVPYGEEANWAEPEPLELAVEVRNPQQDPTGGVVGA